MNLLKKPFLNENEVQDLIPQGTPFVMVDKMHYYSEDKVISGFTIQKENMLNSKTLFTASRLIEMRRQTAG